MKRSCSPFAARHPQRARIDTSTTIQDNRSSLVGDQCLDVPLNDAFSHVPCSFGVVVSKLMILADINEVRDFPSIEARLGLGYRACLHPCTRSLHQLQKSRVMLHGITPFAISTTVLAPVPVGETSWAHARGRIPRSRPSASPLHTRVQSHPNTVRVHADVKRKHYQTWRLHELPGCDG